MLPHSATVEKPSIPGTCPHVTSGIPEFLALCRTVGNDPGWGSHYAGLKISGHGPCVGFRLKVLGKAQVAAYRLQEIQGVNVHVDGVRPER